MTFILFLILMGVIAVSTSGEAPELKENTIVFARFNSAISDRADENPLTRLMSSNPFAEEAMGLDQILKDLKKAAEDENVRGIFMNLSTVPAGFATLSEIRDGLLQFKESGKFIYAYADTYTQKGYYLASAADSIFMTPEGMFLFSGMNAEIVFFKNALDKAGIEMQVVKHGSYKSAAEQFTRSSLSPENREQIEGYVGAIWDKYISDVSESRGISPEALNAFADEMKSADSENLLSAGLIDGLIYYDEMLSLMKEKTGVEEADDLEAIKLASYKDVVVNKEKKAYSRDKVAVIYAMGMVVDGNSGEGTIGSERISRAIRKARRDETVKAIVLRVNSGGGSAIASDVIYREVKLAAEAKPVVASMGDVAASGGYYISAPADTIVASPGTITGSIGVVYQMPNMKSLMNEKIGVTTDVVKTNTHADLLSLFDPLDPEERQIIQHSVDNTYEAFVNVVAEGRGMSPEAVDRIAGGRVWAGTDALEIGLIDLFGGLERSIELAAEMAGLESYRVQSLPKLEDPVTKLMKELTGGAATRSEKILRKTLGPNYSIYRELQDAKQTGGLQATMPFKLRVY